MSAKEFGVLLSLGAIWGASFMFMKVGGAELGPFAFVEVRLGLAALIMLAVVSRQRHVLRAMRSNIGSLITLGLLNCAIPYTLFTWGETYVSSGLAAIFNACTPLWGAALGLFWTWGERLSLGRLFGVALGFAGVALVVSGNIEGGSNGATQLAGSGACLLAALSYAVAGIYGRHRLRGVPALAPAAGQLVTGALVLLPLALFQIPQRIPSIQALGSVVTLAILGTAVASMIYYWLLAHVGSTKTLLVTYLLPGFALVWGALFLREAVTVPALIGLLLVLLGIAVTTGGAMLAVSRLRARLSRVPAA